MTAEDEAGQLRSVALQNAQSILQARRRAEDALLAAKEDLRESNERTTRILESITDGFAVFDQDWRCTFLNRRAETLLRPLHGPASELLGESLRKLFPGVEDGPMEGSFQRAMNERVSVELEAYYAPLKCWLDMRAYPSNGGLTLYFLDITTRKAAEEDLRQQREWFEVTLSSIGDGVITTDTEARVTFINPVAELLTGWTLAEAKNQPLATVFNLINEKTLQPVSAPILAVLRDGKSDGLANHTALIAKDGTLCSIEDSAAPILNNRGEVSGAVMVFHNVTERHRAEARLRETAEQLDATFNQAAVGIAIADLDGRFVEMNQKFADILGYSPTELKGRRFVDITHESDRAETLEQVRRLNAREIDFYALEKRYVHKQGRDVWSQSTVTLLKDAGGNPRRFIGVIEDITKRKEEARILELLSQTWMSVGLQLDLQALLQTVTDAATSLTGAKFGAFFYNQTDANGDSFLLYTLSGAPREAFDRFGHPRATALFGPTFRGEGVIRCDDVRSDPRYGQWGPHHGTPEGHLEVRSYLAVPVVGRLGDVIGGLFFGHPKSNVFSERSEKLVLGIAGQAAIAIDNARLYETAQKAAADREVLLDSERAARSDAERAGRIKDEFLATLSHELRTPLSAILGWSYMLKRKEVDAKTLQTGLETIERNARAQTQLIEDLLDMSRITSGKLRLDIQPVIANSFVQAAIETVMPSAIAKGVLLEKTVESDVPLIHGDPARLQQVVWNLLSNAIKFTPKGGTVLVTVRNVDSAVELSVADSGIGIQSEFLPYVFDRFRQGDASTTRRFGGLGLGLSIVKHLVELHGGTVRVESGGTGAGATFITQFPLAAAKANYRQQDNIALSPPASSSEFSDSALAGLSIVVVDDEPDACELIQRVLTEAGATVRTADRGMVALQLISEERPSVIVSDIGMPEMDGYELMRQIRILEHANNWQIPAVALTAFARSEDRARVLDAGYVAYLTKPVEPADLVATLATIARRTG